jgi:hypothetical protein
MHRAGLGSVYVATEDRGSVWAPRHVLLLLLAVIVVVVVVVVIVVVVVVIVIVVVSSLLSFSRPKVPFLQIFRPKAGVHFFLPILAKNNNNNICTT